MSCQTTYQVFSQAFLAGTPEIAQEILDFTYKQPTWLGDLWDLKRWEAKDSVMQQLIFRGSLPEVERGFDKWKRLASSAGCEPCTNDCSYNFTVFQGHGFERRLVGLMKREFKTPDYCIYEIRDAFEFEQTFDMIIQNINQQVQFFKEFNIGLNYLTGIAKKILVTNTLSGNPENPYEYRALGSAQLSKLNYRIMTKLYEGLHRRTDVRPFMIQDGKPLYAASASDELLDAMYIEDPNARADLRFSSASDALVERYNFVSSIRGQFLNAPIMYPRRFLDPVLNNNVWIEVYPYVNGLPAEVGSFSDLNPAWENAPYEELLIYGRSPFSVFFRESLSTIGNGATFGPDGQGEPVFMNSWYWSNIPTECDPLARMGRYLTVAEIAPSPQYSGGVYGLIFPRPQNIAEFFPAGNCPPDEVECDNDLPAITSCPCPPVLSARADDFTAGLYILKFGVPLDVADSDPISIGLGNGGYLSGTVTDVSDDGLTVGIQFAAGTVITNCQQFTAVFCDNTLGCSSKVVTACDCRSSQTGEIQVTLENPIKAVTAAQIVYGNMGDGTTQHFSVVSVDLVNSIWYLEYAAGYGPTDDPEGEGDTQLANDLVCDRNGIISLCVPPSTDATCPECSAGPILTPCAS